MKIKTQFRMTMFLFGSVVTAALALVIITDSQAKRVTRQAALATGVAQAANEMSYLSNDYLIYREEQQIARWRSSFGSLLNQIDGLDAGTTEEQMLVRNIKENTRRLKETFDSVLAVVPNSPRNRSGGLDPDFLKISSSRLAVQTQGLFSDAQRLSRLIEARANRLKETRTMLVYALLCLFGLFLLANYTLTYRRTISSLAKLQAGAKIIGSGNLSFQIRKERNDEIGELSEAFNQMTAGLKTMTASKTELEKEMEDRKQAEEALRESETRYRSLFEHMLDGFAYCRMLFDEHGHPEDFVYLDVNNSFGRLTGMAEVIGKRATQVIPGIKELNPELFDIYGRVALTGNPERFEIDFKPLSLYLTVSVYSPAKGYFVAVFDDISKRKHAEAERSRLLAEVQAERDRLSALVASIRDEVWFADTEKRFTLANPSALREFGLNTDGTVDVEKLAASLEVLRPDGSPRPVEESPPLRALKGEIITNQEEIIRTPATGELRYRQVSAAPVRDGQGNIIGSVSVAHDITERKKAEEALRESEERLRLALTAANLGTWDYNPSTGALVWDARCKELFGLPPEAEVDYDTFLAGLHPEDRDRANEVVQHTFDPAGDGLFDIEYRTVGLRDGGMLRWIRATGRASFNNVGQATRFTGTVQDITERKHAEEALRESELQFRMALRNAPVSVAAQDLELRYIWAFNQRTAQSDQIIGHFDHEIFTSEEAAHITARKRRVIEENIELRDQMWLHRPGGRIFLDISWEPILDEAGKVIGVASATVDLTQIKLVEEALRKSEQKYRNLFENMAEEVHYWQIVRDEDGRIKTWRLVDANPPTLKAWGRLTAEEIRGKTTDEIFGPGATEHYMPVVEKIMTEGVPYSFEDYFPNLDKHFRFTSVPFGDFFITTGADITVIKQAQESLKASLAEKEVLLKEIHHRVKNNMQVISSLISLQAIQLQDAGMRAILDEMAQRVRSMAMVHEKLYQSHNLAGVEFSDYAKSLLNYLWRSHATAASSVRLTLDLEPVSLTVNTAVPCGLILNELVTNALKHAFRGCNGGEVTVSLRAAQGGMRFSVRDDGTGLPSGFDWKQATSLGLRLVQMLAGQLHADVEVSSNRGTEFTIAFGEPKI